MIKRVLLLAAALCWLPAAFGEPASDRVGAELAERFAAVSRWRGEFVQTLIDINGNLQQQVAGQFALQQPNLVDWRYAAPLNQRLISDGETLWFYDRDLEQVTVRAVDELLLQSPAAILLGQLPVGGGYAYRVERQAELSRYIVVPTGVRRGEVSIEQLTIIWQGEQLQGLELLDGLGQRTALAFARVERNPELAAGQFTFIPPEGVDVVH